MSSKVSMSTMERDKDRVSAGDCKCPDYLVLSLVAAPNTPFLTLGWRPYSIQPNKGRGGWFKALNSGIVFLQNITFFFCHFNPGKHLVRLFSIRSGVCALHYVPVGLFTSSAHRSILIKYTHAHTQTHSVLISCWEMPSARAHFENTRMNIDTHHSAGSCKCLQQRD